MKFWYNYVSVTVRKYPTPADIPAEMTQGLRLFKLDGLALREEVDGSLSEGIEIYHNCPVDIRMVPTE